MEASPLAFVVMGLAIEDTQYIVDSMFEFVQGTHVDYQVEYSDRR